MVTKKFQDLVAGDATRIRGRIALSQMLNRYPLTRNEYLTHLWEAAALCIHDKENPSKDTIMDFNSVLRPDSITRHYMKDPALHPYGQPERAPLPYKMATSPSP